MSVTVTQLGPWSVNFPIAFRSGGDTTREAFGKHIEEIERIYELLNALDSNKLSAGDIDGSLNEANNRLQNHINSTNPHPNWRPSLSFSDITGNLDGSRITGTLTNATIDASKVNGLQTLINEADKGDGITGSNLNGNGYVKFGNGLIIQWGSSYADDKSDNATITVRFPISFSSSCFNVSLTTRLDTFSGTADVWAELLQDKVTKTGFGYQFQYVTDSYVGMGNFSGRIGVSFIAIGI